MKNRMMGTIAIVADPDVSAWKLIIRPTTTDSTPIAAATGSYVM